MLVSVSTALGVLVACGSSGPSQGGAAAQVKASGLSLRFGAVTERNLDFEPDGRNATAAVTGMNEFAIDLYRDVVAETGGNTVVGPYSAVFALSMIYAGARGQTAAEMADVLHADALDPAAWHEGINAYDLTLDARTIGSPTTWNAANQVWTLPGMSLLPEYLDVLTGSYGAPLAELDFAADPDGARQVVNGWVEEQTAQLIPELFPEGAFHPNTVMALVNAVVMDAPWEFPFDPAQTRSGPFTLTDGTTVNVPTMHYDEYLGSMTTENLQAVLSMVVIVPKDLTAFEASLTAESLDGVIDEIQDGGIHLSLPKWSARTQLEMTDVLSSLGMPTAFSASADFSGMTRASGLTLARVDHEAFVEVDEEGTRAAAATGGVIAGSHGPTVEVNRPYLYVIRDRGAGTFLFLGRVVDPSVVP
jgi:serpin B